MKLFSSIVVAAIGAISATQRTYAQKAWTVPSAMPVAVPALHGDYGNYKSYEDFLIFNTPDMAQMAAKYNWPQRNIPVQLGGLPVQDGKGDFKIIFQLNGCRVVNVSGSVVQVEVILNAVVYDKGGDACWNSDRFEIPDEYTEQASKMGALGKLAMSQSMEDAGKRQIKVFQQTILLDAQVKAPQDAILQAICRSMDAVMMPFCHKYLPQVKTTLYPFMSFAFSFKKTEDYEALTNAVAQIDTIGKTGTIKEWTDYVYGLEPMMEKYAAITGVRNEEHYHKVANFNLASLYLLKGDTIKANEFMANAAAIAVGYEDKNSRKWYDATKEKMFTPAQSYGAPVHPGNMEPAYSMDELLFRTYILMFKGTAYLKDGTRKQGIFLLANDRYSQRAPLILDLGQIGKKREVKPVIMNIYESLGMPPVDTVSIARIDRIEEPGGGTIVMYDANRGKQEAYHFFRTVYHSPKLKIFTQLFPEPDFEAFYMIRPLDSQLWASPLIISNKTMKNYFKDCAPMTAALEKSLVSWHDLPALGKYYTENCN